MRVIVTIIVCSLLWWPAATQAHPNVGLFADPTSLMCGIADNGPRVLPLYVIVQDAGGYPGLAALEFAAPLPSCFEGATFLSDTFVFPVTMGDSQVGISIGFGSCRSAPIHVLTINLQVQGLTEGCCPYPILPHPNSTTGQIEFADCLDNLITGASGSSFVTPNGAWWPPLIDTPYPPNGQTGLPPVQTLTWDVHHCSCGLGDRWCDVYFGTTPEPPLVAQAVWESYDPGQLQLNTTYFWRIRATDTDTNPSVTMGPLWSFTVQAVPVQPTTWGRIKGMYAD